MKGKGNITRYRLSLIILIIALVSGVTSPGRTRAQQTSFGEPGIAQSAKGSWNFTGKLITERRDHTATLLANGKVLVAGGRDIRGNSLEATELYDPATATWTVTGALRVARSNHTATMLPNGKVIVIGGAVNPAKTNDSTKSIEVYDQDTGIWSSAGNLIAGRFGHTATLLQDGTVLVSAGFGVTGAELYDPTTEVCIDVPGLTPGHINHTATLLQNGKVLVVGGIANLDFPVAIADLYDPATRTWSRTGNLNERRGFHMAESLANGTVLVANGLTGYDFADFPVFTNSSEVYDPATGAWSKSGFLSFAHIGDTSTLLSNGVVLIAGGVENSHFGSAELYNADSRSWREGANLNTARYYHSATLLRDGRVLVAGGQTGGNLLNSVEVFDPRTPGPVPKIFSASVEGKRLILVGENFSLGAIILLNGEEQMTLPDGFNPEPALIGKRAGKKIRAGDKLQIRNADGTISEEFPFAGSQANLD